MVVTVGTTGTGVFWMSGMDILRQIMFENGGGGGLGGGWGGLGKGEGGGGGVDYFLKLDSVPMQSGVKYRSLKKLLEEDEREREIEEREEREGKKKKESGTSGSPRKGWGSSRGRGGAKREKGEDVLFSFQRRDFSGFPLSFLLIYLFIYYLFIYLLFIYLFIIYLFILDF